MSRAYQSFLHFKPQPIKAVNYADKKQQAGTQTVKLQAVNNEVQDVEMLIDLRKTAKSSDWVCYYEPTMLTYT